MARAERMDGAVVRIERTARGGSEAGDWIERLARFGYAAKGAVYLLVGWLALRAALGDGGSASGSRDALQRVAGGTPGTVLLALIAAGLIGYVVWQLVAAVKDPEADGTGGRLFRVVKALLYGGLVVEAGRLALSGAGGGGGNGAEHWTARLMEAPAGTWLVGAAAIGVLLYGLYQLVKAWTADLDDELRLAELDSDARRWVVRIARFGLAARGVVLGLIGAGLLTAALQSDPGEARGLGEALRAIRQQPWGAWLLGIMAAGLTAYGLYQVVRAKYRRFEPAAR